MKKDISLVYMVAGMSSRFGGRIKQFAKVGPNDSTLIEYSLAQALPAGFSKIIFIVGKMTEGPFKDMFGDSYHGIPVEYALQDFDPETRDRPRGTVDALCSAKDYITGPFVVCNGDDIYGKHSFKILYDHLQEHDQSVTLGYVLENVIPELGSTNRGIFTVTPDSLVAGIKECIGIEKGKLADAGLHPSDLCSMNIFGLTTEALRLLTEILAQFKAEHGGERRVECYLPSELSNLITSGKISMKIYPTPDPWFGVTNPDDESIVKQQIEAYEHTQK